MKKFFLLLIIPAMTFVFSCGHPSNPLVGKWKFEKADVPDMNFSSDMKSGSDSVKDTSLTEAMDTLAKGLQTMGNAMAKGLTGIANGMLHGTVYEFDDDGTTTCTILFFDTKGKYTLSPDNKTLTWDMGGDGKPDTYTITTLNDKEMVLTSSAKSVMHFSRVN